jgi:hypothetical protein|nr:MAG TPA: hypothetical protein [Caudoviricetes sp.]
MNIREGMGIKTLQGKKGTVTKVEMQSHHGEVWYDLRIKPDDTGDRFGNYIGKRIEWHGLEKDMYKYFESVGGENLQTVSMSDFKALREQVIRLTEEVKTIKETLNRAVLHTL